MTQLTNYIHFQVEYSQYKAFMENLQWCNIINSLLIPAISEYVMTILNLF